MCQGTWTSFLIDCPCVSALLIQALLIQALLIQALLIQALLIQALLFSFVQFHLNQAFYLCACIACDGVAKYLGSSLVTSTVALIVYVCSMEKML